MKLSNLSASPLSCGTKTLTALVLAASSSLASAAQVTIDFDHLDASSSQPLPLTSFSEDGYTFNVSFNAGGLGPVIFDTTCSGSACNDDEDLIPTSQGENGIENNILILQEPGSNVPDDNGGTGSITLTLVTGTPFRWEGFSAIDDTTFTASTVADGDLGEVALTADNQTGSATFSSSVIDLGDTITIAYGGSGGVDSLILNPVPLPAAFPLFFSAMAGLSFLGFRRRKI